MQTHIKHFNFYRNLFAVVAAMLLITHPAISQQKKTLSSNKDYHVAAYIWPSCHHDARFGDMLWPQKTGEWEVIKKGTPRFEGHYQPKMPLWGYELDNDPKVMEKIGRASCRERV